MSFATLKAIGVLVAIWLFSIVIGYQLLRPLRPHRTNLSLSLFNGVDYKRTAVAVPRRVMVHLITIDLTRTQPSYLVTQPDRNGFIEQYDARTTSDYLSENDVQIALNGGFFYPFWSKHPLSFYPQKGDPVTPLGITISDGQLVQNEDSDAVSVLCIGKSDFHIHDAFCPLDTMQALSGNLPYVRNSEPTLPADHVSEPLPRTMLAYNNERSLLWLVVADGRQPLYSRGLTLLEMQQIALDLGAEGAINLDGGGSSTLVIENEGEPYTLNAPIHTRIPMRQRPVANHLGIRLPKSVE